MCGIAGALVWNPEAADDPAALVSAMTAALGHRGPDGRGVTDVGLTGGRVGVALGHTRLAILDLSERGAQPMKSPRAPIWLTFNGEIYNFAALRSELEACGRTFVSRTDTEVILQGYEEWGSRVIERLRGMFAFAIWDGARGELLLARDRLGIKPLYIYRSDQHLLFASEVRALLASGVPARRLDPVAVEEFLTYQSVPPPRTLVADVHMVRPGHWLRAGLKTDVVDDRRYWDLLDSANPAAADATRTSARAEVKRLLAESAELHLVSDVPVGIFLSGGIDSSAIVAMTRRAGVTPRTFTVVLPGSPHDEAPFARTMAEAFQSEHTEIAITGDELRRGIPDAVEHIDHPSGDGINTFVVSRAVRRAGVKVALSGLGGDELFGGYPSFRRMQKLMAYGPAWRHSPASVRSAAAAAVRTVGRRSVASVKAAAVLESDGTVPQVFPLLRQLFAPAERRQLLAEPGLTTSDPYVTLLESAVDRHPDVDVMSLVSYAECRTYMHDVLLRDTDQMSMAHGLEVRVPLLDDRLVEYVMGLPEAVKATPARPKQLLVESLDAELPSACIDRPKQGFVLPFDVWMRDPLRGFCEHALGARGLGGCGLFREDAVNGLWKAFLAGDGTTTWSRPWALVALGAWIERHGMTA